MRSLGFQIVATISHLKS